MSGGAGPPTSDALAAALHAALLGGHVQRVHGGGPGLVVLAVRRPARTIYLGLSTLPGAAGALLLDAGPDRAARALADPVDERLRAVALGARISGVSAEPDGLSLALGRAGETWLVSLEHRGRRARLEVARGPTTGGPGTPPAGLTFDLTAWSRALVRRRRAALAARGLAAARRRVRRARKRALALVAAREDDLARLGDPGARRAAADALAAHVHQVRRGQDELVLDEWAGGGPLRIVLDPALAPAENLRRAYRAATRAERGRERACRLLEAARRRVRELDDLWRRLPASDPTPTEPPSDEELARTESVVGEANDRVPPRRRVERPAVGARPAPRVRRYTSREGHAILVGRDARGNDELTVRIARGNDLWLHAREVGGSHVVVRLPRGAEIPQETLLDAATLAHAFSRAKDEPTGTVTWCRAKHVRKVRGAPPGSVLVTQERVLHLRLEPERLARLLATCHDGERSPRS